MAQVIGVCGFAGTGKTTIANHLVAEHGFQKMSFADGVKDITAATFGWDRKKLAGATPEDRQWREQPDEYWTKKLGRTFTPRIALQFLGTDIYRTHIHPNIWADITMAKIRNLPTDAKVVIDDVRFCNERDAILEIGGKLITVLRDTPDMKWPYSPLHEKLWGMAGLLTDVDVSVGDGLHLSEWDWLRASNTSLKADVFVRNNGGIDELHKRIDQSMAFGELF